MKRIIGKCSICGGRVSVPGLWMGIYPPIPTCESCGATAEPTGPVIPMKPKQQVRLSYVYKGSKTFSVKTAKLVDGNDDPFCSFYGDV